MNRNPLISVVVPIYNVEAYLDACLTSIAHSSVQDIEVLMVDDGSKDSSPAIARHHVNCDSKFHLVSQPNRGNGAARNVALRHARGEFIAFADADDIVPQHAYAALLGAMRNQGVDFAAGHVLRMTDSGKLSRSAIHHKALRQPAARTRLADRFELFADTCLWNKLYKRDFAMHHLFPIPEGSLYEDLLAVTRAYTAAHAISIVPETVYHWRKRADGSSITQGMHRISTMNDRYRMLQQARALVQNKTPELVDGFDARCLTIDLPLTLKQKYCSNKLYRSIAMRNISELLTNGYRRTEGPVAAVHRIANLLADGDFNCANHLLEQSWRAPLGWSTVQSYSAKARDIISGTVADMLQMASEPRYMR
jgi:glycosyltransferase involved in cell wall biosynthesis